MHNPATQAFIREHLNSTDLHRLLLSAKRYPEVQVPYAVAQIEALRKVRDKIPSWYSPDLIFPLALSIEQSSSEETAQFKTTLFAGKHLADLTGGMGIDSFFWTKVFEQVDYVEQNEVLIPVALHNFKKLNTPNIQVHHRTAEAFLGENNTHYDLIYLDPARRDEHKNKVFRLSDCQPNVVELLPLLFNKSNKILVKTAPMLDITEAIRQLGCVTQVWITALHNECKEVLYLLEKEQVPGENEISINAVHLAPRFTTFSFTKKEEEQAKERYSLPQHYLYEPDAAIFKAGAFKVFGTRFGLSKLHSNTHLYTSDVYNQEVPGRIFEIISTVKYDSGAVLNVLSEAKANIAARNFPDSIDNIRKKLKLKDGGDWYLFAVTLIDGGKNILICKKMSLDQD